MALKLPLGAAMTRQLLLACALLALPAIGCVGGPPVDESAPAAAAPQTAARSNQQGNGADHNLDNCHQQLPPDVRAGDHGALDGDGIIMPPDGCGGGGDGPNGDPH